MKTLLLILIPLAAFAQSNDDFIVAEKMVKKDNVSAYKVMCLYAVQSKQTYMVDYVREQCYYMVQSRNLVIKSKHGQEKTLDLAFKSMYKNSYSGYRDYNESLDKIRVFEMFTDWKKVYFDLKELL